MIGRIIQFWKCWNPWAVADRWREATAAYARVAEEKANLVAEKGCLERQNADLVQQHLDAIDTIATFERQQRRATDALQQYLRSISDFIDVQPLGLRKVDLPSGNYTPPGGWPNGVLNQQPPVSGRASEMLKAWGGGRCQNAVQGRQCSRVMKHHGPCIALDDGGKEDCVIYTQWGAYQTPASANRSAKGGGS